MFGLAPEDAAQVVTAFAAVCALVFGIIQVLSARATQRESTAKQIWMTYELQGLKHPRLSNPELVTLDHDRKLLDGDKMAYAQYEWFVSFMLLACEEVLRLSAGPHWESAVSHNLDVHWSYISHPDFTPLIPNLSPQMRRFIEDNRKRRNG